jgi:tripartite-type tricarboxylate transporter receptor subunit TctC
MKAMQTSCGFLRARVVVFASLVALAVLTTIPFALAQGQSGRVVKFLVGFGTGGPTDIVARVLADQVSETLGSKAIVENKTGASGNIATQALVTSPADGYTFLIGASPIAINHWLFPDFPIKFGKDFVAVAPIGASNYVLVVNPALNVNSFAEFVNHVRARPGKVTYATLGIGSASHLAGIAFDQMAGTSMTPAAYRGGGEALKDLMGGHIDAWFAPVPSVLSQVRGGQLIGLAVTGLDREVLLPNLPTVAESGLKGFDVRLWVGLFAPAGLPDDRMALMEKAVDRAMASEQMGKTLSAQGVAPFRMNRTEFSVFVDSEIERWRSLVSALSR